MGHGKKVEGIPRASSTSFEFYDATDDEEQERGALGLTWADGKNIHAIPLVEYLGKDSPLPNEDMRNEFLKHLPFKTVEQVPWPLPGNPCHLGKRATEIGGESVGMNVESVAEWEELRGRTIFEELKSYYSRRLALEKPIYYTTLALWTMAATIRLPEMVFAPSLLIQAPFGWGKSTAAEAVGHVVPRCVEGANISSAATYRVVTEYQPALIVDESAIADNPDLQRVVKVGFKKGPKILRAKQNADHGIVTMDPWTFLILTIQVNPRDDIMSRCLPIVMVPGSEGQVNVRFDDQDARVLRTVLMRLRLEARAGMCYANFKEVALEVRALKGLESRTKDKIESLWPIAKKYECTEELAEIARDAEEIAKGQYEISDEGVVATALQRIVDGSKGDPEADDLMLTVIHSHLTDMLIADGEGETFTTASGTVQRLPRAKYGARDFTAPILRKLGFKTKLRHGQTCIDLFSFKSTWPAVQRRYIEKPGASQSHLSLPSLHPGTASPPKDPVEMMKSISTPSLHPEAPDAPSPVEMGEIQNDISTPKIETLANPPVEMVEMSGGVGVGPPTPGNGGASSHFLENLDEQARCIFLEKREVLQKRFSLADAEFGSEVLQESIEFVAERRSEGERPSPYRLRSHLTTKFTTRAREATTAVDLHYAEISELADLLRRGKRSTGPGGGAA